MPLDLGYQIPAGISATLCVPDGQREPGAYKAIFTPVTCGGEPIDVDIAIDEVIVDDCGFKIPVPNEVADNVGIYSVEFAKMVDGRPSGIKSAVISVEESAWAQDPTKPVGITIDRIRMHMRDTEAGGAVIEGYEYSTKEIISCLLRPIEYWNDTPPPNSIKFSSPQSFPYTYNWMEATISCLLKISATWYLRQSKRMTYSGGLTTDDRDKADKYLALAMQMWAKYEMFVQQTKLAIIRNQGIYPTPSALPVADFGSSMPRRW
jgi:hypothetical protein